MVLVVLVVLVLLLLLLLLLLLVQEWVRLLLVRGGVRTQGCWMCLLEHGCVAHHGSLVSNQLG